MIRTQLHRKLEDCIYELTKNRQIVAIYQNESEWGPRALGNRSILFDPTNPEAKDIVNGVKKRESYRPFACTILEEHAHEYVELRQMKSSPYMSFAFQCKEKAFEEIPALVHCDNTCRIQTVNREQNKNYYDLIKAMQEENGVPIIFNTSFNLHGESMVESIFDAIHTCNNSEINHIYIPEDQVIEYNLEDLIKIKGDQMFDNNESEFNRSIA